MGVTPHPLPTQNPTVQILCRYLFQSNYIYGAFGGFTLCADKPDCMERNQLGRKLSAPQRLIEEEAAMKLLATYGRTIMNIICVVTDTLRADHLPTYGSQRVIAPYLTQFAQEALVFEDCHAASFPTVPTRADIATGRFTFTYLTWGPLPPDEITLAGLMTKAGYTTMGIGDTPFLIRNGYGYDRGFDDFIWIRGQREASGRPDVTSLWKEEDDRFAPQTFKAAMDWLERHYEEKFFLTIDAWDPHEPWDPPAHYVKPYLPDYAGEQVYPAYWDWRRSRL